MIDCGVSVRGGQCASCHSSRSRLESVENARDPRMRTIRINDFWRGVVLAPDDGSDVFLLVNVVPHDDAHTWAAAKRLYTTNSATRALEVRNVAAIEQLTPALETAAAADSLLFVKYSDTVLRELGIDEQILRAVRTIVDEAQLRAFETLLPEDQCEVLQYLAEGFSPEEVYRDIVALRRPVDAGPDPHESLAVVIANTTSRSPWSQARRNWPTSWKSRSRPGGCSCTPRNAESPTGFRTAARFR